MRCGVGRRRGFDLALLWCRPAAIAPIGPLAWEPGCASGAALKSKTNKQTKINKNKIEELLSGESLTGRRTQLLGKLKIRQRGSLKGATLWAVTTAQNSIP